MVGGGPLVSPGFVGNAVKDAVQVYFSAAVAPLDISGDSLAWWKSAEKNVHGGIKVYLGPLARKYLSIPGSSGTIERVWSKARRLLGNDKAQLEGDLAGIIPMQHNMPLLGMWPGGDIVGLWSVS